MLNVAGSTPAARSRKTGIGEDEKAPAVPIRSQVTPIPAQPAVRLLDLIAAFDAAALAGDLHAESRARRHASMSRDAVLVG
jgi:hypothetical protein